jgi:hypothetical protein
MSDNPYTMYILVEDGEGSKIMERDYYSFNLISLADDMNVIASDLRNKGHNTPKKAPEANPEG